MSYKIINNSNVENFRNEYVRFTIYDNKEQKESETIISLSKLKKFIVEPDIIDKTKRHGVLFNPSYHKDDYVLNTENLISGKKTKDHLYLPNVVMIDLDFKTKKSKQQLKKDVYEDTFKVAYLDLIRKLKLDECVLYMDTSHSGGIKILFNVISDYYLENADYVIRNFEVSKFENDVTELMKRNSFVVLQYLEDKYDLKFHNDKEIDYIDTCSFKPTQLTFSSKGKNLKINQKASIIFDTTKFQNDIIININKVSDNKLTNDERINKNNTFCDEFFNYVKTNKYIETLVDNYFKKEFSHYNEKIFFSIYFLDDKYLNVFFRLYKTYYRSNTMKLNSFEEFKKYVHRVEPKYNIQLKTLLWDLVSRTGFKSSTKTITKIEIKQLDEINLFE